MSSPTLETISLPAIRGGRPVFENRFRFMQPTLPPLEDVLDLYRAAYEDGRITNGDLVARFESAAAERLGVGHCVAMSSCTSGLMLVLRCLELTGEVIVPSFTFFATGHAILWNGLRPVLADCDPATWNVDPEDVERRITARTSAIVAVHLYGNPCAVEALQRIARRHNLKLIFDAAHGFGSRYRGIPIGQFGDAEVFSLTPTKPLVAGEGGLVTTGDPALATRLKAARNYGDAGTYDPEMLGLNARMTEFQACMALPGIGMIETKMRRQNRIAEAYTDSLCRLPGLSFQQVHAQDSSTYKDYSIRVNTAEFGMPRDELAAALLAENIETKKYFYPPLHEQKLYREYAPDGDLPHTAEISREILSLPIYDSISDDAAGKIAYAIARIQTSLRV